MSDNAPADATRLPGIAVLGAGTMGSAMARRLLRAGFPVHVWNRTQRPALALARVGAFVHDDPRDAVSRADVVLSVLPTAAVVTDVVVERGVLAAMSSGAVWAQMGTIGIEETAGLEATVRARRPDVRFVDAPVSGSRGPAESGELIVLASGPDSAVATLTPVFAAVGRRTLWLGPAGYGSRMKLVINTWLAFEVEAAAEAAALAAHFHIDPETLRHALAGNPVLSPLAGAKLAKMEAADDEADFSLAWALKDLDLAGASAGTAYAPVAGSIAERWRHLVQHGYGHLDVSVARLELGEDNPLAPGQAPAPTPRRRPSPGTTSRCPESPVSR